MVSVIRLYPINRKVTKCGHVFCNHCILHHCTSDRVHHKRPRCPLCYEPMHTKTLRSTSFRTLDPLDTKISFKKLFRPKVSVFPFMDDKILSLRDTVPAMDEHSLKYLPWCDEERCLFCSFSLATREHMIELFAREERELRQVCRVLESEGDTISLPFANEAIAELIERQTDFKLKNESTAEQRAWTKKTLFGDSYDEKDTPTGRESADHILDASEYYCFMQKSDGEPFFLHNINVRMLVDQHGELKLAPDVIEANILEIEYTHVTEDFLKKHRFLRHLPLQSLIAFVEIDMSSLVSEEVLEKYEKRLAERKRIRERRVRREESISRKRRQDAEVDPFGYRFVEDLIDPIEVQVGRLEITESEFPTLRSQSELISASASETALDDQSDENLTMAEKVRESSGDGVMSEVSYPRLGASVRRTATDTPTKKSNPFRGSSKKGRRRRREDVVLFQSGF
eukprot:TRINITY_DN970_c0_g1_i2.p1 TRINITY_DN970_c0_g1~~TRINITY_DN970_c0_g1_i2.p1  ORF type:complete len:455 (+),score=115.87 TRINITY_DN970_c0_g1_i2:78-1442(+)